jgi:two-component system, chemotaxis family, protein-glutamate methylesterase/glutaminase
MGHRQRSDSIQIAGKVYVAPPDFHAEFLSGEILLTHTAPVHFSRPSADRAFLSGAEQGRVIGVVIAQDAATADHFGMPQAAIETGAVDFVLPIGEIGPALTALARTTG